MGSGRRADPCKGVAGAGSAPSQQGRQHTARRGATTTSALQFTVLPVNSFQSARPSALGTQSSQLGDALSSTLSIPVERPPGPGPGRGII